MTEGPRLALNPNWWGHHVWESLHFITLGYPEHSPSPVTRQAARNMLLSLRQLLPCSLCRQHLTEALAGAMPLTDDIVASREAFGHYIVRLRDYVKQTHVLSRATTTHEFHRDVMERLVTKRHRVPAWVIGLIMLGLVMWLASRQ